MQIVRELLSLAVTLSFSAPRLQLGEANVGSNLSNNNVNTVSLAWKYWGILSSSFEIEGNTTLPRSACGLRGSGWYCPQSLRTQTVFPNTSSPDSQYSPNTRHREELPSDPYWVIRVTGRSLPVKRIGVIL